MKSLSALVFSSIISIFVHSPNPLFYVERCRGERRSAELDDDYLNNDVTFTPFNLKA